MTLQLLHSEFPYIWGKNLFSFLSVQRNRNRGQERKVKNGRGVLRGSESWVARNER
jgi:hypothetical protein